jgi:CDP-diacylglycerol--glycerol-3-phosphate 3-phosphatidyltransferase
MKITIPTALTLLRIAMIPLLVVVFYLPIPGARTLSALIFLIAAFSDWLDGFLARRLDLTSRFGAFLDPVADKLIVATALIVLLEDNPNILFAISTLVIIGREITISALREWMAEIGQRTNVAVSYIGKIKTAAQMTAITMLLYQYEFAGLPTYNIGLYVLYLSVILTIWSMMQYLRAAWPALRDEGGS